MRRVGGGDWRGGDNCSQAWWHNLVSSVIANEIALLQFHRSRRIHNRGFSVRRAAGGLRRRRRHGVPQQHHGAVLAAATTPLAPSSLSTALDHRPQQRLLQFSRPPAELPTARDGRLLHLKTPDPGGVSMLPLEWTQRRVGYPSRGPTPHASSAALACAPPGPLSDTRPPSAVRPPSAAAPVV